jgi:hypothetical protein
MKSDLTTGYNELAINRRGIQGATAGTLLRMIPRYPPRQWLMDLTGELLKLVHARGVRYSATSRTRDTSSVSLVPGMV